MSNDRHWTERSLSSVARACRNRANSRRGQLLCALPLCLLGGPTLGQSPAKGPQRIDAAVTLNSSSIAQVLHQLHGQTGIDVLADGITAASGTPLQFRGSARSALDRIGNVFGYSWSLSRDGDILLRRSFTSELDYPQLCLPEWQAMARDIDAILPSMPFVEPYANIPAISRAAYQRFPRSVVEQLQAKKPVGVADLPPDALDLINRMNVNQRFSNLIVRWPSYKTYLAGIDRARLKIVKSHDSAESYRLTVVIPASNPIEIWEYGSAAPSVEGTRNESRKSSSDAGCEAIGALVRRLRTSSAAKVEVEPCIADRKVLDAVSEADPRRVLHELAELYDWEVGRTEQNVLVLRRPRVTSLKGIAGQFWHIREAIPFDLRTFCRYFYSLDDMFEDSVRIQEHNDQEELDKKRSALANQKRRDLAESLRPLKLREMGWRLDELSPAQREDLMYVLLLSAGARPWAAVEISRPLPPHVVDVRKTTLMLWAGGMLMRGTFEPRPNNGDRFIGDGAPVGP